MPKEGMDIVRITLKIEDLKQLIYKYEGSEMVTLDVAKMQKADNFDGTHTVYGTVVAQGEKPQKKRSKRKPCIKISRWSTSLRFAPVKPPGS